MVRKYTSVKECPKELSKIIAGVNHLPDNPREILKKIVEAVRSESSSDEINYNTKVQDLNFEAEIINYLTANFGATETLFEVAAQLRDIIEAKPILQAIAETNRETNRPTKKLTGNESWKTLSNKFYQFIEEMTFFEKMRDIKFTGTLELDGEYIRPILPGLIKVFDDNKRIPISRIRSCAICEKIYWAKKTNSETCGEKQCVDALGNRKRANKK